ncbi:MAG: NYN domain-containing protein [Bdellovibrionaceae bacterium]|nr:NYN domain-containing protein [Bdellovibrionales bacterium]MCB9085579.1 NYN domain-containing protein [Pseudobdellovibrionaceae bacterium]
MDNKPSSQKLCFQKVGIFVDAENIELSGLKHMEGYTNYKKILDHVGDREIIRILYYKPEYKEISSDFVTFWKGLGGEIRRPAKNADTFLVIDAVTMADKLDVAIILGGDKDFLPLVWYLKSRGCRTEIWSWPQATSQEVKEAVDQYFPLDESFVLGGEEKKPKKGPPRRGRGTNKKADPSKKPDPNRS